jgi:dienelactone hydrolase
MSNLVEKALDYSYGDTRMSGHYAVDSAVSGPRPGILVVHDAFGLADHAIAVARRLAALGYAALAIDLWGGRRQFDNLPEIREFMGKFMQDREMWMGRVDAARVVLCAQPEVDAKRLAATGYCFGGTTVLEYARTGGEVGGVVSFHGGLDPLGAEWDTEKTKAKLLVCTGAEDPMIPASSVVAFQENLRKTSIDWEVNCYSGTTHAFTRPDAGKMGVPHLAYNAQSDRRSWESMCALFREIF